MQQRILAALRDGNYVETAAQAAGVGQSTLYEWRQRFPEFAEAIARAQAEAETKLVRCVAKAAPKEWRAAIEILQRTRPNRFALRVKHLVDEELNAFLDDLEQELEPEQFQAIARIAAGRARREEGAIGTGLPAAGVDAGGAGPAAAAARVDPGGDAEVPPAAAPAPVR